ncbi:hypothetical protein ACFWH4_00975 [Streptomyces sp. NPDC127091]|uniref:hypothetical protein n=1 Tax=Streptomyces sp. NPDC127091 TaxID=3347134 RepID=UPI003658D03B
MTISPIHCPDTSCPWAAFGIPDAYTEARAWHLAVHRAEEHDEPLTADHIAYATRVGHVLPSCMSTDTGAPASVGDQPRPLDDEYLTEIAARAGHLYEYSTRHDSEWDALAGEDVPALLAELAAVRAERDQAQARLEEMTHLRDNALRALYRDDVEVDIDLEETIAAPFYGPGWDWDEGALQPVVREAAAAVRPAFAKLTQQHDKARDRIAELEALTPAPIQTCRVCGAGYTYGQPCSTCEFNKRMAAETGGAS